MARGFDITFGAGTTDAVTTTLTSSAALRSYAFWAYRNGFGGSNAGRMFDKTVEQFINTISSTHVYQHVWSGGTASWNIPFAPIGVWNHFVLTYESTAGVMPSIYVNGLSQTVSQTVASSGTVSTNGLGYVVGNRPAADRNWDGMIAEFAIWDRILSADEAWGLGNGYSPLFFPLSLVEYVPMLRDNVSRKNAAPTVTGTAVQPHPKVIYPATRFKGIKIAGQAQPQPIFTNWSGVFQRVA